MTYTKSISSIIVRTMILISAILTIASCGKDDPEIILSDEAILNDLRLSSGPYHSSAPNNVSGCLFITVPNHIDLKAVTPEFDISEGATVLIEKEEVIEGKQYDFSNVVNITVISESNYRKSSYKVIAKNGDPYSDRLVYDFMNTYSIPGVAVAVMKGENIVYSSGYGFAIKETDKKVTPDHLFRVGSVSKQFTTLCIMKLVEDGLISIDDHVFGKDGILDAQFPGISGKKAAITIRNFLQHNSGFPTSPDPMFTSSIRDGKSIDDLIRYVLKQDLAYEPGSTYSYYNMGFGILGRVVEVVSGKPFEEFLKKEVLEPMGVTDTHIGKDRLGKRDNEVVYYMQEGVNGYGNPMDVIYAAGGIITSANQLMEILKHIDGNEGVQDTFKKETLDLMYNSPSSNYARYSLGWRIGHTLFPGGHYHSGNLGGTAAFWVGGTDKGMSGCILCNSRSYISNPDFDSAMYVLMHDLLDNFD
ncbi:MAG: beta-lactamase family protein [Bacteroidales bacterium]|nr:beta-lactamase family protein [Bacteroidales bacterium]